MRVYYSTASSASVNRGIQRRCITLVEPWQNFSTQNETWQAYRKVFTPQAQRFWIGR